MARPWGLAPGQIFTGALDHGTDRGHAHDGSRRGKPEPRITRISRMSGDWGKEAWRFFSKTRRMPSWGPASKSTTTRGPVSWSRSIRNASRSSFHYGAYPSTPQAELKLTYKGRTLKKTYQPDFCCFDQVIVEIKAVSELTDEHRAQVHNYLKATGDRLGLLVNFGAQGKLLYERIVR